MISPTISRDLIAMSSAPFTLSTRLLGPSYVHNGTYIRLVIWPSRFIPALDKTLTRLGDWSVQMRNVRADQKCIWKCLLWDAKPLTKHMLTYDLLDPYEQISVKC